LLISDIHFDPFYDGSLFGRLNELPAERWGEVLEGTKPPGINPRGTDTNYPLLKSSLDEARNRLPNPDFILYPGDLMAHEWQTKYDRLAPKSHVEDPAAYRAFTTKAIRFLAAEFRKRYPETAILPTLGNDDSYCGDYSVEPNGPFLSMFAEVWEPLLGANLDRPACRETFSRGGYYSIPLPGVVKHRLVVLNSIFFSVNFDNACDPVPGTPAIDQLRWFEETVDRAKSAGETVWLLMHIPPGINSFNTVESMKQGGPVVSFWQPELSERFLQLIRRHSNTIRAVFAGHTHMDEFLLIPNGTGQPLFCKIAPAISPIFGNNPGFQVYHYDRGDGRLENYQCYFLPDRREGASQNERWDLEYEFRSAYGLGAPNSESLGRLVESLAKDGPSRQLYSKFFSMSGPPEFSAETFEFYRCAMMNLNPAEFLACLRSNPFPKVKRTFPDRRLVQPASAR